MLRLEKVNGKNVWELLKLYRSFGFEETGDMDGEEVIAVLKL